MKIFSKIFVGGGFPKQTHFLNKVLIDSLNPKKVFSDDSNLKDIFPESHTLFNNLNHKLLKGIFYLFLFFPFTILFEILKIFSSNLNAKNWFFSQILHSYWDTSIVTMNDGEINPSRLNKFNASRSVFNSIFYSLYLIKIKKVNLFVLGHSVYGSRTMMAVARLYRIPILNYANWNYHFQKQYIDSAWWDIDSEKLSLIKSKDANDYFEDRIIGKGKYEDANNAVTKKSSSNTLPKNVIFLHIFKDSSFNVIDKKRIFKDYFDWISNTLLIVSKSSELWSLRLHPSASRWGENQICTINNIIKDIELTNNITLKNVVIENSNERSNIEILNNANRIVTFNGTIHLEALCFGVKPIVISECMMTRYFPNSVFKPTNLNEYKNFLLKNINTVIKEEKDLIIYKKLIYYRENFISLNNILKSIYTYRGDSENLNKMAYNDLKEKCEIHKEILSKKFKNLFIGKISKTDSIL